jgi:hypothetical protein
VAVRLDFQGQGSQYGYGVLWRIPHCWILLQREQAARDLQRSLNKTDLNSIKNPKTTCYIDFFGSFIDRSQKFL